MGWLGYDVITCPCGWVPDPTTEADTTRVCSKCGRIYDRKNWGWSVRKIDVVNEVCHDCGAQNVKNFKEHNDRECPK